MSSGTNNKVNTSTQVEYNLEIRSIVGQEDSSVEYLSNSLGNMSLRNQSKGVRPPLVGQASSSSNDSVALPYDTRTTGNTQDGHITSPNRTDIDQIKSYDSTEKTKTSHLLNRNDFINQKPPEGSYYHTGTSLQPAETNYDFTRVRSSSSASSVTSSRPLEWDNGADVGYSQCYAINGIFLDPNMSTVERMALVRSTKLLRRSDPEGTTGGTCQQISSSIQPKMTTKNKFGHPNAESTPLGTNVTSDSSPVDFISPIPHEKREECELEINSSDSEEIGHKLHTGKHLQNKNTENQSTLSQCKDNIKYKIPLFPEMSSGKSDLSDIRNGNISKDVKEKSLNVQGSGRKDAVESYTSTSKEAEMQNNGKIEQFNHDLMMKLEAVEGLEVVNKKLSSSLENVCNLTNNAPLDGKIISYTLPRSQSQTDLNLAQLTNENYINNKHSKCNLIIQNLFKNKSASSSSVATVVQRKGDSPKHAFVQTSVFKKQSVGTQVSDSMEKNKIKSNIFNENAFIETPHLPRAVLTQQAIKKSNYFDFSTSNEPVQNKFCVTDQSLVVAGTSNINCEEKELKNNYFETHFHNGILCTGAHRKCLATEHQPDFKTLDTNCRNSNNCDVNTSVSTQLRPTSRIQLKSTVCSTNVNAIKNTSGGIIDSVESSVKSGGCGTDKQFSVTVEDRANSFEYLPGHVYENNERQQPINSCGTSSMSIENQSSNIATPEDQNKIWESSVGSMSSTFEKDAQRGVDILSDFVKGAYEDNTLLKRKLIRRVVDKLISKNHIDRKIGFYRDLLKNTPWVPPRPSNPLERENFKTPRSKVPCELSSQSEKSGTTNTSSECFIPRPTEKNKQFPSFLKDDSCQKYHGELTSTSNVTPDEQPEKPQDRFSKPLKLIDNNTQKVKKEKNPVRKQNEDSFKISRTNNWKEPVTKTEKLIEERRKMNTESSDSHSSVFQLLDMERENQLFWIRSEIEHLSNLKLLLERQKELKRGLKNFKPKQSQSSDGNKLIDQNRVNKNKTQTATSAHKDVVKKKSSLKTRSNYPPKLSEWLKDATKMSKTHDVDFEGWASHNYENDENIKSCIKRKSKHQIQENETRTPYRNQNYVIYDEPSISSQERKDYLKQHKHSTATENNISESASTDYNRIFVTNKIRPSKQVDTKRQQGEPEHNCQCLCRSECQCCNKPAKSNNKKKEPLGYYIIFDNPKKTGESKTDKHQVEEIRLSWPMSEQKQNPSSRKRAGADNVSEKEKADSEKTESSRRNSKFLDCETRTLTNESEDGRNEINPGKSKPIFKGGAGELQYHLLHNRPTYVSRAEDRRQCIAQMQYLRELSSQNKRRLLSLTQPNPPPPPPIKIQRVFSQQKMRQMTEKKYRQLSEVRKKVQDTKKKEGYRTNRLMAEIFKKNLQKRVLKGEVNLSNSVFVISSL